MNRTWYLRVFVHRQELRWLDIINDSYVASHGCEVWEYSTTTQVKWCKGFRTEVFVVVKKKVRRGSKESWRGCCGVGRWEAEVMSGRCTFTGFTTSASGLKSDAASADVFVMCIALVIQYASPARVSQRVRGWLTPRHVIPPFRRSSRPFLLLST